MSVKTMGLVWDLDIPQNEKFVLLAYADHADHNGRNMFPAVATIAKKTGYSERSVQRTTRSLEQKGYLVADGKGKNGTNKWKFGRGDILSGVTNEAEGVTSETKRGDTAMAPEPSLTVKEPSKESIAKAKPLKANQIPQIVLFREVTRKYPAKASQFTVITSVDKVGDRLLRDVIPDDLEPFYREWCDRGYNPMSVKWLEWAVSGKIPTNGKQAQPQGVTVAQAWLQKKAGQSVQC